MSAFRETLLALLLSFYLYCLLDVKQGQNDSGSANNVSANGCVQQKKQLSKRFVLIGLYF